MSYQIYLSNGNLLTTIPEDTIDGPGQEQQSTSINLVGRNYPGYGTAIADDLVWMLEHFAAATEPSTPLDGQLWFDSENKLLKLRYDSDWNALATADSLSGLTLTVQGDVIGTGPIDTPINTTLANSGATPGTYTKVTVDPKGRVTVGASLTAGDLPFMPVQQGGGASQNDNKIYLGWDGAGLRLQVDSTDKGDLALMSTVLALATVPTGVIVMWSGSLGSVPSGWHLCDGTNGTPNLLNRFVICAGGSYAVNNTGGAASYGGTVTTSASGANVYATSNAGQHYHGTDVQGYHTHGGGITGEHQIIMEEMWPHEHGLGGRYVVTDASLSGGWTGQVVGAGPFPAGEFVFQTQGSGWTHHHDIAADGWHAHTTGGALGVWTYTGGDGSNHTHAVTTSNHTHTVTPNATGLPPYFALAYIMKL